MACDKKLHFIAGLCLSVVTVLRCFYYIGGVNLWLCICCGITCGMVIGVAKELYDQIKHVGFDYLDMLYTWAGAIIGAGFCYIVL